MAPSTQSPFALPTFSSGAWQMSYGERVAFEGLLAQVSPVLAVEIGTADGGSLERIAAHSTEVHSFDLVAPGDDFARLENVTFHTGDSHRLVAEFLERTAVGGRFIDFVLIDGDHSAEGVRRDLVDVLASDAVHRTVIVLHDTLNPEVRRGIAAAAPDEHPKVALYEPDLVPGYLARREPYRLQLWGGLGLILVDADRRRDAPGAVRDDRFHELFSVLRPAIDAMAHVEARGTPLDGLGGADVEAVLRDELAGAALSESSDRSELVHAAAERDRLAARLAAIEGSRGWRLILLLRGLKALVTRSG